MNWLPDKKRRSKGSLIAQRTPTRGLEPSPMPTVNQVRSAEASAVSPPSGKEGLALITKLPPLPTVVTKLMQLIERRDVGLKEISNTISSDPAFSVEVLGLANSAMIGAMCEVRTISQALALVGTDRVKGLALTVGMRGIMGSKRNAPVMRQAWRHTLATAILAEEIADKAYIDSAEAYTAGLLHDIGRIALITTAGDKYGGIYDSKPGTAALLMEQERAVFGLDSREAGVELVRKWNLPVLFERVICCKREEADRELRVFDCAALVELACGLAGAIGLGFLALAEDANWQEECEQLIETVPAADRKRLNYCWEDLKLLVESKVNLMDSEAFK